MTAPRVAQRRRSMKLWFAVAYGLLLIGMATILASGFGILAQGYAWAGLGLMILTWLPILLATWTVFGRR